MHSGSQSGPRIVWVGFHDEGSLCIPALFEAGFQVNAIITLEKVELEKRSGVMDFQPLAEEYGIPLYNISHINDTSSIELLKELQPEVIVVIGWSQILNAEALGCAPIVLGTHASLLPRNRGSAPINWAIINGEKVTGNTLMLLQEGVDTGPIVAQRSFPISPYDSCASLYRKVAETNAEMVVDAINGLLSGALESYPQLVDETDKMLPRRRPRDGDVDWHSSANTIYDFIRALTRPYPGAFSKLGGVELLLWKASLSDATLVNGDPGSVAGSRFSFDSTQCGVDIFCGDGIVTLHQVELPGGEILEGSDLVEYFRQSGGFDVR